MWTADELRAFLAAVEGDRLYAAWWLLGSAGLRRGEVLGLRWADLDLGARRLAVRRSLTQQGRVRTVTEPKTNRGRRSLALDTRTVAVLEAHRRRQLEERLALGLGRPAADGLIFTDPLGEPVKPDSLSQLFKRAARSREHGVHDGRLRRQRAGA